MDAEATHSFPGGGSVWGRSLPPRLSLSCGSEEIHWFSALRAPLLRHRGGGAEDPSLAEPLVPDCPERGGPWALRSPFPLPGWRTVSGIFAVVAGGPPWFRASGSGAAPRGGGFSLLGFCVLPWKRDSQVPCDPFSSWRRGGGLALRFVCFSPKRGLICGFAMGVPRHS